MNKLNMGIVATILDLFFGDEWPAMVRMQASWTYVRTKRVNVLRVMRLFLWTVMFIESRPWWLERTTASTSHLQLHMCARTTANNYRENNEDRLRGRWRQIIITKTSKGNRKANRKWR